MIHSNSTLNSRPLTSAQKKIGVGQTLVNQAESLIASAITLKEVTDFVARNGLRTICSATTIFTGLSYIASCSHPLIGAALTVAGTKELYHVTHQPKDDVSNLLENASAGLGMVQMLEEKNKESFQLINSNLKKIGNQVTKLNTSVRQIKTIATYGQKELEEQKKKTCALYSESLKLFSSAQRAFETSHRKTQRAAETFNGAENYFEALSKLAKSEEGDIQDRLDQFIHISEQIHHRFIAGKGLLDQGNEEFAQAMAILDQAIEKQMEASVEAGKAINMGQAYLQLIKERAKANKKCEELITQTKAEAMAGQKRSCSVLGIVEDVQSDIEAALQSMESRPSWASVFLGGGAGAVTGSVSGVIGILSGLAIGTALAHAAEQNLSIRKQMSQYSTEKIESAMTSSPVTYAFNPISSGIWGRYQKKQSWTVGTISIDLGDIQVNIPFNMNEKRNKISKVHLLALIQQLERRVVAGCMNPKRCLKIIENLEMMKIDRGSNHSEERGFIAPRSPYFAELRNLCLDSKRIENLRKNFRT